LNGAGLIVLGAGGHARVVLDVLAAAGRQAPMLLVDDNQALWGGDLDGVPVAGPVQELARLLPEGVREGFVAVGSNASRRRLQGMLEAHGLRSPVLRHPSATVSPRARLGPGTLVCAAAVVGAGTRVGVGVIVNTGAQVDHDCDIGDFVHLAPGSVLCGGVAIGPLSLVGAGANVAPGVRIGSGAVVGVGAAVIGPVADGATVVGVPARVRQSASGPAGEEPDRAR